MNDFNFHPSQQPPQEGVASQAPDALGQERESVGRDLLYSLPFLALIVTLQSFGFWLCLQEILGDALSLSELTLFTPLTLVSLTPLFLYLNWDYWRPGKRTGLLLMALGVGLVCLLCDFYAFWGHVSFEDHIFNVTVPAGFALFLIFPFFRQRLAWDGTIGLRPQYQGQPETVSALYAGLPPRLRAWLPEGRYYLEEQIRAALILLLAFLASQMVTLFIYMVGELWEWYYYGEYLVLLLALLAVMGMLVANVAVIIPLACLRITPLASHLIQKILAWANFGSLAFGLFALVLLPIVIVMGNELFGYFIIAPLTLLTLLFAASLRDSGPLSQPVCALITRIGAFLPLVFFLACFWELGRQWGDNVYWRAEETILIVNAIPFTLLAVLAVAAAVANRLHSWLGVIIPGGGVLYCLLLLLLVSPALNPDRIAAAAFAEHVAEEDYDEPSAYDRLSWAYGVYGKAELEQLARRPGETEKDQMIRELAQRALDWQSYLHEDGYNNAVESSSYEEYQASEAKRKEEIMAALRALPVWPPGRIVPEEVLEEVVTYYTHKELKGSGCSRFFLADFNQDGVDDVMFLNSPRGYWYIYEALSCAHFTERDWSFCGNEIDYYKEELAGEAYTTYTGYRLRYSGYVDDDGYIEGEALCEELGENLAKGVIGLEAPKPDVLNLRIGDMLIESGRY